MAVTAPGSPYVESSDLVANYPGVSESLAERVDLVGVLPFADSTARGTALPSPTDGQYSYLQDTNTTEYYDGSAWVLASAESWTLISTTALSGTSTTVSGIPSTYKNLHFVVSDFVVTSVSSIYFRINNDSTSDRHQKRLDWVQNSTAQAAFGLATEVYVSYGSVTTGDNNNALILSIFDYANTTDRKNFKVIGGFYNNEGQQEFFNGWGNFNAADAISSVLFTASGSWSSGNIYLYGEK